MITIYLMPFWLETNHWYNYLFSFRKDFNQLWNLTLGAIWGLLEVGAGEETELAFTTHLGLGLGLANGFWCPLDAAEAFLREKRQKKSTYKH